jgi:hypothetical protein
VRFRAASAAKAKNKYTILIISLETIGRLVKKVSYAFLLLGLGKKILVKFEIKD